MIFLSEVDSTNIYAMKRISDGMSHHGEVIWTHHQTGGRGQRDKKWIDEQGRSVLMSIVILKNLDKMSLFELNMRVSYAIMSVFKSLLPSHKIRIKWPNDIFIDDKKACGILIENGFRGNNWHHSVVGVGINVLQEQFPESLGSATSLFLASGIKFELEQIASLISKKILEDVSDKVSFNKLLDSYNRVLFKANEMILLQEIKNQLKVKGKLIGVNEEGKLMLSTDNEVRNYTFGSVVWMMKDD